MHRRKSNLLKTITRLNRSKLPIVHTGVFPNYKEWVESQAMFSAVQTHLSKWNLKDPSITMVSVGDGKTPRCGVMFAFHTKWKIFSVDPDMWSGEHQRLRRLSRKKPWLSRLSCVSKRIQDNPVKGNKLLIVACHAHVSINDILASCSGRNRVLVCMPCCVPQDTVNSRPPDIIFPVRKLSSEDNIIKIWRRV